MFFVNLPVKGMHKLECFLQVFYRFVFHLHIMLFDVHGHDKQSSLLTRLGFEGNDGCGEGGTCCI